MPSEGNFAANLRSWFVYPGVRRVGQHFAAEEGLNATFLQQRHLLSVTQVSVGLVLDYRFPSIHGYFVEPVERISFGLTRLMNLSDDRRCSVQTPTDSSKENLSLG